jgi:hypothetical protein
VEQQNDLDYINSVLERVGNLLSRQVTAYHIGGNAMCALAIKSATKDTDLVLLTKDEVDAFRTAVLAAGFMEVEVVNGEYAGLDAFAMFEEKAEGNIHEPIPPRMRIDLFLRRICHRLRLSKGMASRSTGYLKFGSLENRICSKEDIFLFKALAGRPRDIEDMSRLARVGFNWSVVGEELEAQKKNLDSEDISSVKGSIESLNADYGILAPPALTAKLSKIL